MTKSRKLILTIYNLSSLLTRRNLVRITTYIKLFGIKTTFNEVNKKLWQDNYFSYGGIKSIPLVKKYERSRDRFMPFDDTTISVVIPVKNAGDDFQNLLSLIKHQKGFKNVEIIVVDSGSTDNSLEIASEFRANIIKILPEEFSHSYARNLGAKHASGDYVLFTVQDALPTSDLWLYELFSVIKDNEVVAVSCVELPREDADLFYKAITWCHNNFMELDKQGRVMCKPEIENHLTLQKNAQLINIACLISRNVFMKYGFRGSYAEDLDLGIRLIRDDYKLAIISSTKIIHSHTRPAYYYLRVGYVEHLHLSELLPNYPQSALDLERLICEIESSYKLLNLILQKELKEFKVPCTINKLSSFIMQQLYKPYKNDYFDIIDSKSNGYIDNKFRDFLDSLFTQIEDNYKNNFAVDGILIDKMQSFTAMILEFMNDNYKIVDHQLLEEFKLCLYKAYAFICGIHLASCILRGSKSTRYKLKEINNELTRGV